MLKKTATTIAHTLSNTSKMPGKSYSISAFSCKTGSKLAKIPGTVCSDCYARKNAYVWKTTQSALLKRESSLDNELWVEAMVTLIGDDEYFRWHDSGDIQSEVHLHKIVQVAELTPRCNHWLPTKEVGTVLNYVRAGNAIPENLVIRFSAPKVNSRRLRQPEFPQIVTCRTVSEDTEKFGTLPELSGSKVCDAPDRNNECGPCRDCWNPDIKDVCYWKH